MRNKMTLAFVVLFVFSGFLPVHGQQTFTLKKDIVVAKGETQNNILTFGGEVLIEGKVKESVVAFGGTVIVSGEVGDLVLGFGTTIVLKPTAVVKGDVASLGGTLTKEPGCTVEGDTIYFKTSEDVSEFLEDSLKGFLSFSLIQVFIIFKLISTFIWLLLALVVVALFPRQLAFASSQIRKSFWPVFGIGLMSIVVFTGLVVFSALLCLVLIGIPILLALIILAFIIKIFSQVTLFFFFGESLLGAIGKSKPAPILAVIIGLIIVSIIGFIPFVGFIFSFFLSIIGWGVAIRTKFGTTENWFGRKKQALQL
jgi:cytoskeletal protein CcmA (bactofilin family)